MKKLINEKNIIIILVVLNIIVAAGSLIDYKTDRLIDASVNLSNTYIYKK